MISSHADTLSAWSLKEDAEIEQVIDVRAERWAVVDYWNDGTPASEMLSITLHDQPVSFN